MSAPDKIRGDKGPVPPLRALKLRTAEEREWAYSLRNQLNETTGQPLTQAECRGEIREKLGISLGSDTAYSDFCSWQFRQRLHDRLNQIAEEDEQQLADQFPGLSREKIREATIKRSYAMADLMGDPKFTLQVIKTDQAEDSGRFRAQLEQAKLDHNREALQFDREKFEITMSGKILQAAHDEETQKMAASKLSNAEKIAWVRQKYFSDVEELQQSGDVKLPD